MCSKERAFKNDLQKKHSKLANAVQFPCLGLSGRHLHDWGIFESVGLQVTEAEGGGQGGGGDVCSLRRVPNPGDKCEVMEQNRNRG